jgi:hypothetical protein
MGCFGNEFWKFPVANADTLQEIRLVDVFAFFVFFTNVIVVFLCFKKIFEHEKTKLIEEVEITGEALIAKDLLI